MEKRRSPSPKKVTFADEYPSSVSSNIATVSYEEPNGRLTPLVTISYEEPIAASSPIAAVADEQETAFPLPSHTKFADESLPTYTSPNANRIIRDHITSVHRRLVQMIEEARQLRCDTADLVGDYIDLEKKFKNLRIMIKETLKEAEERNHRLDEIIYLDKVIKHLKIADKNMQYVPCVIKRK